MSLCWEVWGLEEAGRVLALMKVSSHQVLAVLAAVGNPTNFTAGHSQAGQSTQSPGSQVGQRQLSKEFLESPEQEGPSDPWALKLRSLMSARQPLPPHSCRRGWVWSHPPQVHTELLGWPHEPPNRSFDSCHGEAVSFLA